MTERPPVRIRSPRAIGGEYVISRHIHFWNVDHRKDRGRTRRQLGFAYTLDEAKAIVQADREAAR